MAVFKRVCYSVAFVRHEMHFCCSLEESNLAFSCQYWSTFCITTYVQYTVYLTTYIDYYKLPGFNLNIYNQNISLCFYCNIDI